MPSRCHCNELSDHFKTEITKVHSCLRRLQIKQRCEAHLVPSFLGLERSCLSVSVRRFTASFDCRVRGKAITCGLRNTGSSRGFPTTLFLFPTSTDDSIGRIVFWIQSEASFVLIKDLIALNDSGHQTY